MSWFHIGAAFAFLLTGGLLFLAERFREYDFARYFAMGSLPMGALAGILVLLDVPDMGALMDPPPPQQKQDAGGKSSAAAGENDGSGEAAEAQGPSSPVDTKSVAMETPERDCTLCPSMVNLPAGIQRVGADDGDALANENEKPAVGYEIGTGFAISRREVSAEEYLHFLQDTGKSQRTCPARAESTGAASCLTWSDALAYTDWLSQKTGYTYTLPTAAQWEYAARGHRAPVDAMGRPIKSDTGWGVFDMGGGLAEFVADCWSDRVKLGGYGESGYQARWSCGTRMLKDGANGEDARWVRPSARRAVKPNVASSAIGFRVVRPLMAPVLKKSAALGKK